MTPAFPGEREGMGPAKPRKTPGRVRFLGVTHRNRTRKTLKTLRRSSRGRVAID